MIGTEASDNAFVACAGQVLLLCPDSLPSLALRTWEEQRDLLISKYEDALWLALAQRKSQGFARSQRRNSGVPLPRQLLKQKKMSMLNEYVERENVMISLLSQTTPSSGPGKLLDDLSHQDHQRLHKFERILIEMFFCSEIGVILIFFEAMSFLIKFIR